MISTVYSQSSVWKKKWGKKTVAFVWKPTKIQPTMAEKKNPLNIVVVLNKKNIRRKWEIRNPFFILYEEKKRNIPTSYSSLGDFVAHLPASFGRLVYSVLCLIFSQLFFLLCISPHLNDIVWQIEWTKKKMWRKQQQNRRRRLKTNNRKECVVSMTYSK